MKRSVLASWAALAMTAALFSGVLQAGVLIVDAEPGSLGPIPDGAGAGPGNYGPPRDVRFQVDDLEGRAGGILVSFRANHGWVGDLRVRLIAPDGTEHLMFEQTGVSTDDLDGFESNLVETSLYTFGDFATTHWWDASDDESGNFDIGSTVARTTKSGDVNASPLPLPDNTSINQAFLGTPIKGTWILRFEDGFSDFVGEVTEAVLTLGADTADIVVLNANDSGPGSLRAALASYQPGQVIGFEPGFFATPRTIDLLSPLPVIDAPVFIDGPGANRLTVQRSSAAENFSIFSTSPFEGRFAVSGLRISNGVSFVGGAILTTASSFRGSELDLVGNLSGQGGGLYFSDGQQGLLLNSLVRNNSASGEGSGIYLRCTTSENCLFEIRNTTISLNETDVSNELASIGLAVSDGAEMFVDFFNNTIVGQGTGMRMIEEGTTPSLLLLDIGSSIFSLPSENIDFGDFNGASIALNQGFNVSSLTDPFLGSTGGQDGVDPRLSALADNGGPTPTHAIPANSPAVDNGLDFGAEFDQRGPGFPRTFNTGQGTIEGSDGTDAGAFEFLPEDRIFGSRFELESEIIRFDNVNFTPNDDSIGGSIRWVDGTTCDCDDPPFDFNLYQLGAGSAFFFPNSTQARGGVSIDGGQSYAPLSSGATVGPDAEFMVTTGTTAVAAWNTVSGQDAYLGFRFEDNGVIKYGYARIETGPNGSPATILSFAYEDSGLPITIP